MYLRFITFVSKTYVYKHAITIKQRNQEFSFNFFDKPCLIKINYCRNKSCINNKKVNI